MALDYHLLVLRLLVPYDVSIGVQCIGPIMWCGVMWVMVEEWGGVGDKYVIDSDAYPRVVAGTDFCIAIPLLIDCCC